MHRDIKEKEINDRIAHVEAQFRPSYNAGKMTVGEFHMIRKSIIAYESYKLVEEAASGDRA
jgi:hypothetical protein